jgi:hypothetical protein
VLVDVVAALAYDLEAGRPEARQRAEQRLAELRTQLALAPQRIAAEDSVRASRQRQPLGRPLANFAGAYAEPSYGTVTFTLRDGRLEYRWGALYGPAEIFDAAKQQLRIEIAGSGTVVTFTFAGAGPAQSIGLQGVTFTRAPN